jgi:hypothetical protein
MANGKYDLMGSIGELVTIIEKHKEPISKILQVIQVAVSPISAQCLRSYKDLPLQLRDSLLALAEQGWFLDFDMPLGITLKLKEYSFSEIESFIERYFDERKDAIKNAIIDKYPHRAHIVISAFNAHARGEYELAIPVLFAQSDGICEEETGDNVFRGAKKPQTFNYVERLACDIFAFELSQALARKFPLSASKLERKQKSYRGLNRHMVMHGESQDYGTKINSLKVISLINYVTQVFAYVKAQNKNYIVGSDSTIKN